MSLILRKTCQPLLDENGLSNYHIDIDSHKYLSIVGECGQPLVSISGISFHKFQPTRVEIDYAAELLDGFLGTHKLDIENFISQKAAFKALKEPEEETPDYEIDAPRYGRINYTITYIDKLFTIALNDKGNIETLNFKDKQHTMTVKEFTSYKFDKKRAEAMMKTLLAYVEYREVENKVDEAKLKLAKCDI